MKTIIVACGAGVATSTLIVDRLNSLLKNHQIRAKIIQCNLGEIEGHTKYADLIVTSMKLNKNFEIPSITAVSFITGVGQEETESLILSHLNS
ncbi:PTS sugar transporter subunit IIB [Cytobacillus firmus]|uniref:PTS system galactitol-specific transporter subunit IIB n=1 Tax=Cytobacillus firmus DS1 TaxID=1307436 RepID=W7KR87_CYTFI|nr:PTS sugar transporter subunit IIB [Cytobacillus firmus]EWG10010.1 PTS system galactitol-specific transporter subunit IIB [Cytobacillus firmus DS1]